MNKKSRRLLIGALTIAVLMTAGVWLIGREKPVPVEVARVERGTVEETVTNSRAGTVEARRRAQLSPDSGGRVSALPKRKGERVAAGDIVLELDAQLERGEAAVRARDVGAVRAQSERACLASQRAARELERNRKLAAEGILAADLLDSLASAAHEADAACAAARASEASAEAALALARTTVERRTLRAPFAGVVAELTTEVGEWITPSPPGLPIPPVIDLLDPKSIYLSLPMDEVDAGRLRVGLAARVTVDSRPGQHFAGRVARVAPYVQDVQTQNRTVEIEVELDDAAVAASLLPGTSCDVEVILDSRADALRVPTAAVLAGEKVLALGGDRLVEKKFVPGLRNWDFTEVASGLADGERVVTSLDRPDVRAGARVKVANASPRKPEP